MIGLMFLSVFLKDRCRLASAGLCFASAGLCFASAGRCFASAGMGLLSLLLLSLTGTAGEIDFARDVRPILSSECFHCHGPDEESREADLRLDTLAGSRADLGDYAAVVPGDPENSELLRRITSHDPDLKMPPGESGEGLSGEEVAVLRQWIEQGAKWSEHWAFVPPRRPEIPKTATDNWVQNPIDSIVLARLEQEQLVPSHVANRATLLRRLSLDLTGLLPTIEEVDAFLLDNRPDAYQRQVERLLLSPHYGERWGQVWLSAARYADSDGYEKDKPRDVWFFRDWVINSLNDDMPYDQFVIEQIAGDMLPDATQDQRVATGFLRNSMINEEGGAHPEQFRMEAMFDRMDAIGSSVLGLTASCSQCHSHKYDPLTHTEYYQMFAFLNNCHESQIAVYTPAEERQRQVLFAEIRAIETKLQSDHPDWAEQMAAWEQQLKSQPKVTWVVPPPKAKSDGTKYYVQDDLAITVEGFAPAKHTMTVEFDTQMQNVTAIRLELMNDPNLPYGGPGRSILGTCAISEFEVSTSPHSGPGTGTATRQKFATATADISLPKKPLEDIFDNKKDVQRVTGPVEMAMDGKIETAWGINAGPGRRNQPREAVFAFSKPVSSPEGTHFSIEIKQHHGGWNSDDRQANCFGRFRLALTNSPNPVANPIPGEVQKILDISPSERTAQQTDRVFSYWRSTVSEWQDANNHIEALWSQHPEGISQLVLAERKKRRQTHRLDRGDFLSPKEPVEPGVPDFLHPLPEGEPLTRLTFARWLVDRRSPTTARAIVNRVWQEYFGIGISSTASDLGSQGEPPSHPELLDWLAVEFMEHDWSFKHLHRQIVHSATYRQTSDVSAELLARDPSNRLLARGPRFRIDAELVRDVALFASGLLNPKVGGPSVYPDAPKFLFEPPASYGPKTWAYSTGTDRFRRAMYTFSFRSVPYPPLQSFDSPSANASCVRRSRSNTPLQALTTLNEPLFVDCAKALALRTVCEGGETVDDRLTYSFRRCASRRPTSAERKVLTDLLAKQITRCEGGELDPWQLAAIDLQHKPELPIGITPSQLAGWTVVSRVLLNLDETITKE